MVANLLCPRLGQIVHCFGCTLWYEFLLDLEASYILGTKIDFLFLLVTEEQRRIVQFRRISNLFRNIVWITSDIFSTRCSYSCNRFPCRSSLACTSARGGGVRIFCLSSWPGAAGFPGAFWPTGNSSITSATAPKVLSWLTEMTIWRSNSMFCVLPLKCILLSFLQLCCLILLSPRHWYHGISDDRILRSSAASSLQFGPKIHLVCSCEFRATSFQIQAQRKTNDREGIFQHIF